MANYSPRLEVPQSLENEMQTLGSLIIDADGVVSDDIYALLKSDYFYSDAHRKLYAIMRNFYTKRYPVELVTIRDELKRRGWLDGIGGADYLMELCNSIPSASNGFYYAKEVFKMWQRREAIRLSELIKSIAYDTGLDISETLHHAGELERVVTAEHKPEPLDVKIDGVLRVISDPSCQEKTMLTCFRELNAHTNGGFRPGEMIVLAARPSMGKTAFALNIAEDIAVKQQIPVQIISLEMTTQAIVERMVCSASGIEMWKVRQGFRFSDERVAEVHKIGEVMKTAPLHFTDNFVFDMDSIKSAARVAHHKHGIKLLVIDYMQLIGGRGEEYERISKLSREVKLLANDLNIPVLVLSQLSRALETRSDKRPMLSDLRSSGSIEQDADVVLFLYREDYYRQREPGYVNTNLTECIIAKNRNGQTGHFLLGWQGEYMRFVNLDGVDC